MSPSSLCPITENIKAYLPAEFVLVHKLAVPPTPCQPPPVPLPPKGSALNPTSLLPPRSFHPVEDFRRGPAAERPPMVRISVSKSEADGTRNPAGHSPRGSFTANQL